MALHCKAVLFDFDGTLVDSSEGIYKSLMYAFEADGKPIPDEATLRKFIGPPIYDSFKKIRFEFSPPGASNLPVNFIMMPARQGRGLAYKWKKG